MKKLFITIAFVAATMFASAQLYVGGSLGMDMQNGKYKAEGNGMSITQDMPKAFTFTFAPEAGFMFADNMGVGLKFGFGMGKEVETEYFYDPDYTVKVTTKTTILAFAPYFRYVFAEVDNFKFYADAQLAYAMEKPKVTSESDGTTVTVDGPKTTALGFGIVPGMAYQLTDNISMNCALNILELGFTTTKTKQTEDNVTYTETVNDFGFGVNNATPITIGFYYTF